MSTTGVVLAVVVAIVVVLLVALVYAGVRRRRSRRLQGRFGPEYERTQERLGSRREAERHLSDVEDRRERIMVRPLSSGERERYGREWNRVQAMFVDLPAEAVAEADLLVASVMRDRGYPVDDFDERADMVAVDHPDVVEHYRFAHAVRVRQTQGPVDTETLREALVHYRALAEHLLHPGQEAPSAGTAAQRVPTQHVPVQQGPGQPLQQPTGYQPPPQRSPASPPPPSWPQPPQQHGGRNPAG